MKVMIPKVFNGVLRCLVGLYDKTLNRNVRLDDPNRILLIKTMMIGDVLFVTPSISAIRRAYPDSHITVLVGNWSKDAIFGNPLVDEVITYADQIFLKRQVGQVVKLASRLRSRRYDWTISFHRSRSMSLFSLLIGSPVRAGLSYSNSGFAYTHTALSDPSVAVYPVEMNFGVVRALGVEGPASLIEMYYSDKDARFADEMLCQKGNQKRELVIGMCPGGANNPGEVAPARLWPSERFAKLGDIAANEFGAKILLFGSGADKSIGEAVYHQMETKPENMIGKTTLKQLAALISKCDLLITNDSAPLHIAVGVGTPSVSLFGPTPGNARVPRGNFHLAIQSSLPCSPCYANENHFPGCRFSKPTCLEAICVDEVLKAIRSQLKMHIRSSNSFFRGGQF